jgi:hypothetical protein
MTLRAILVVVVAAAAVSLTACAEDAATRYAYNMRYAYVAPWTHLSAADRSEIIRLVSVATGKRIKGICRCTPNSAEISVFTDFAEAAPRWTLFTLQKHSNRWQITSRDDDFSSGMATAMLSYPP